MTEYTEIMVKFIFSNSDSYFHMFKVPSARNPQEAWDHIRETISRLDTIHTSCGIFINMKHVVMIEWVK